MVGMSAPLLECAEPGPGRAMQGRVRPGWREPEAICVSHQNLCHFSCLTRLTVRWGSKWGGHPLKVPQGNLPEPLVLVRSAE